MIFEVMIDNCRYRRTAEVCPDCGFQLWKCRTQINTSFFYCGFCDVATTPYLMTKVNVDCKSLQLTILRAEYNNRKEIENES